MYRIYWFESLNNWVLYSTAGNEDIAYEKWNECCDKHPHDKVRITKEIIKKET